MKVLGMILFAVALSVALLGSNYITSYRLSLLEDEGMIPYGPLPSYVANHYSFRSIEKSFDSSISLLKIEELTKLEFKKVILDSLDDRSKENLKPYLNTILSLSEEYQVDPFWVISIVMVESNFNNFAISPKNARGLMQIKPDTALHLYQLMQKKITLEEVDQKLYVPKENLEVGIFYLKKLLHNFRLNYAYATVAYNIGPQKLRNRLSEESIDAFNFSYKVKVRQQYEKFSLSFSKTLAQKGPLFERTYVFSEAGIKDQTLLAQLVLDPTSETLAQKSY